MALLGRQLEDAAALGQAVDDLLADPPTLLALGEPTHGIAAFPLLRNELLGHLVERGYRSIVLEIDFFAASLVDDYVNGAEADLDVVLASGFSHGFGAIPGNRELVEWLRAHNAERAPQDRVHFYGFDAPVEYSGAPSPRHSLLTAIEYLPAALRPDLDLEPLLGDDTDWTNPAAMYDQSASIGLSDRARSLRVVADDVASALRRAAPRLQPAGYATAAAHARTALGLLRFHAAMATPTPDRIALLLGVRSEMMADNLLAIVARERHRGPSLVFAHNVHLHRTQDTSAGALVALALGDRYAVITSDANPASTPGTLQAVLAEATTRRALFPVPALLAALGPVVAGEPIVPGHLPLNPADLTGADAVIFIADTDGVRHQYW
ncbi:erythromycin esterase family protein [Actinokineospora globicatena]|uniref:Erythromycin esterase n=1 Tax=Actinokineospora globicatena TaxID=103729 RepID=A0A9W6QK51_9PSEU|nr:erythromycin esterase family protein [Actinokineospora globicatena]GLW90145.1 erythromycin esterase [Actinokineospora globicatena]